MSPVPPHIPADPALPGTLLAPSSPGRRLSAVATLERRSRRGRALTLIEVMIVVAIIGTLAAIAIPAFARVLDRSKVVRAIRDIKALEGMIAMYEMEEGKIPDTLAGIQRENLRDPWGRPYAYLSFAYVGNSWKGQARKDHSLVPLNSTYDLYSMGKDGKTSGPLTAKASRDDIVRANDGGFVGLGADF